MEKVIIRAKHAGVFFGEIVERKDSEVKLINAIRIWKWAGAASLSQLAVDGVKEPENCKFSIVVPEIIILGVIEIITCSDKAIRSINSVKVWKV